MTEESINEALDKIIDALYNSKLNIVDKLELMMNIRHFLVNYEKETGIKVKKRDDKE